jgi:hypothetical protein
MVPRNTKLTAAEFVRQAYQARQRARRLDHGQTAVAPEAILALHHDGEVQALVENLRKGPRGVERQRAQAPARPHVEIILKPFRLRFGPRVRLDEHHAVLGQFRHEHVVQQFVLLIDQAQCARARMALSCSVTDKPSGLPAPRRRRAAP